MRQNADVVLLMNQRFFRLAGSVSNARCLPFNWFNLLPPSICSRALESSCLEIDSHYQRMFLKGIWMRLISEVYYSTIPLHKKTFSYPTMHQVCQWWGSLEKIWHAMQKSAYLWNLRGRECASIQNLWRGKILVKNDFRKNCNSHFNLRSFKMEWKGSLAWILKSFQKIVCIFAYMSKFSSKLVEMKIISILQLYVFLLPNRKKCFITYEIFWDERRLQSFGVFFRRGCFHQRSH